MKKSIMTFCAIALALIALLVFVTPTYATDGERAHVFFQVHVRYNDDIIPNARVYLYDMLHNLQDTRYSDNDGTVFFTLAGYTHITPEFIIRVVADGFEPFTTYTSEFELVSYAIDLINFELIWFSESFVNLASPRESEPTPKPEPTPAPTPPAGTRILRFSIGSTTFTDTGTTHTLEAAPFVANDRTMVPLRVIIEALGATDLQLVNDVVTFNLNGVAFNLPIGQELPGGMGTPVIIANRTFVPLAFIINGIDGNARWDGEARAAYVYL